MALHISDPVWPDPTEPTKRERMRAMCASGPIVRPPRRTQEAKPHGDEPPLLTGIEREELESTLHRIEYETLLAGEARRRNRQRTGDSAARSDR